MIEKLVTLEIITTLSGLNEEGLQENLNTLIQRFEEMIDLWIGYSYECGG